ncbi:MAG: SDR family NAD(P)-dependent oxidoreductase [Lachnospiraceae bacterium]|uniref:SDR family NAD(P)-dependent oxidoreductase n=1 Tax=Candidatus Enterocloster excrementigallinarum TaxID=2838558 RepID=A0A9D2PXV9_9FIRM|nr:SDR family NAD(P)-dependent oxidoreductase [Lachnospiraceae bacterium]HJC67791.1 SDR family NAD(P)-dependent oxidoreductase [Candidatus Enterocloster excrementigallinarum]
MQIAVVTGATSGMGREMVLQLSDHFPFDEVWVIGRRMERLKELQKQTRITLRPFCLDLTRKEDLLSLEQALKESGGEVKFLVNAAGYGKIGPVGTASFEEEMGMVRLNCESLCAVTRMVLPYMPHNSRIIQFASAAAFLPQPDFAVYAATKSFVLSYSRALGEELRDRDIYVTAVCPGPVKTEFFDLAETTGQIPLYKRLVMANSRHVVRKALNDSILGRPVSVYGLTMKAFRLLSKIAPHSLLLSIMRKLS